MAARFFSSSEDKIGETVDVYKVTMEYNTTCEYCGVLLHIGQSAIMIVGDGASRSFLHHECAEKSINYTWVDDPKYIRRRGKKKQPDN